MPEKWIERYTTLEQGIAALDEVFTNQQVVHLAECLLDFLPIGIQDSRGRPYEIMLRYVRTFRSQDGYVPSEKQRRGITETLLRDAEKMGYLRSSSSMAMLSATNTRAERIATRSAPRCTSAMPAFGCGNEPIVATLLGSLNSELPSR